MLTLRSTNDLFAAFADPTRLRILNLLSVGEVCVCDLTRVLGMSQPKVSRHLAVLREAGLVNDRKDGRWVHYSLARPQGALHKRLVECVSCCFGDVEVLAEDLRRLGRAGKVQRRVGSCCAAES